MNLSVLRRMIRQRDLSSEALIYCINCKGECEFLDYKIDLPIERDKELCDFAKDVMAMQNVGGGYIIVGVEDKIWKPVGLSSNFKFDTKQLRDKVRKATGLDIDIDIVEHNVHIENKIRKFAIILIRGSFKKSIKHTPSLIKIDFCSKEKYGLRRGEIYYRKGDSTVKVDDAVVLSSLIDNFSMQLPEDELNTSENTPQFAIEDGNYFLLEKGFESFIGRENVKRKLIESITGDPRIWIINVHGPGGVGKSALVNYITHELYNKKEFEAILQLTAKDKLLTSTGIKQCGRTLYSLENLLDNILSHYWGELPESLDKKIEIATFILCEYKALIILDNMETVEDGRILQFIQKLPIENKSKILITSRTQTGGWELPFPLSELGSSEVEEFIKIRSRELSIAFPVDTNTCAKVKEATGGLPLAIQWILGSFTQEQSIDKIIDFSRKKESPVLEFTFGNIWRLLSADTKTVLAIMPIFDSPPTIQQISIALDYPSEKVESCLQELIKMTLITKVTQEQTGRVIFVALPITLNFALNKLGEMEELEVSCRKRFQKFTHEMALHAVDIHTFQGRFERYGIESDNEKKAALLCQRGESAMFAGNTEDAELRFKEARDLAPRSAYVYAMSASYELSRNRISNALSYIDEALKRKTKKNSSLCYTIKSRIHEAQRDYIGKEKALNIAVSSSPDDHFIRHQFGVTLSKNRKPEEAIEQFNKIISVEEKKEAPSRALMLALKTRLINLQRLNRTEEIKRDMDRVNSIIKNYPHLSEYAQDFIEFLDEHAE